MTEDIHFRISNVVEVGGLIFKDKQELDDFIEGAQIAGEAAFGDGVKNIGRSAKVSISTGRAGTTDIMVDGQKLNHVVELNYHHKAGRRPELTVVYDTSEANVQTVDCILLENR